MNNWMPMSDSQSKKQIVSILKLLTGSKKDVIDIGCGNGRLLIPLAVAGHRLTGIDIDTKAILECKNKMTKNKITSQLVCGDVMDKLPLCDLADVILICGQTMMIFHRIDEAIQLLKKCKNQLKKDGILIIDDLPNDLWQELSSGRWIEGINEDQTMQLIWAKDDACFAIREGASVDEKNWEFKKTDQILRLWTLGSLNLLAKCTGLSSPEVETEGVVMIMRSA